MAGDKNEKDSTSEVDSNKLLLEELKTQRASTKGCMTRIKSYITSKQSSLSATDLECRLGILESYWKLILSHQTSIEKLNPNDAGNESIRGELEDLYCEVKSKILSLMPNQKRSSMFDTTNSSGVLNTCSKINLPKMKLPTFGGKYSDYPNFISKFTQLVGEQDISVTEKYSYLLSCLTGPALRTVEALGETDLNYEKALRALKNRYDNNTIIFQEHVTDMFELPKVTKGSAVQLRTLIDNISAHLSALQSLGNEKDIMNAFVVHLVNTKLDSESQAKWDEHIDYTKLPNWEDLSKVLTKRCLFLETRETKSNKYQTNESNVPNRFKCFQRGKPLQTTGGNSSTSLTVTKSSCTFCSDSSHKIEKCSKFVELPVLERFSQVKRLNLCINCLKVGHTVKQCKISKCRVCSGSHHTLLHRYPVTISQQNVNTPSRNSSGSQSPPASATSQTSLHAANSSFKDNHVFLATALIQVKDQSGTFHIARALLDSASQLNFISDRLVHLLRLKRTIINGSLEGVGSVSSKVKHETQVIVKSRINDFNTCLKMWILPSITGKQPDQEIDMQKWKIPDNIELADPLFYKPEKIDVLIGAETFFELLSVGQIKLAENLPTLQKTLFGWVVSGTYMSNPIIKKCCHLTLDSDDLEENIYLTELVEKFWEVEHLESNHSKLSIEEQNCENLFVETVSRTLDGRLMVKLPFKNTASTLGESFEIAKRRFLFLEKRLDRNPINKKLYAEFLQEYLSMEHMEKVSKTEIPASHYFMPHQYVLRPESSSTPLRVVFDASCKTSSNVSLNEVLAVGPTVQRDLFAIIVNFRFYKYALTADISKMYRQILLSPEDRHFQYIIWRDNKNLDLQIYRLKTVTYGTASAPFLATRSLNYLADISTQEYPVAAKIIKKSFYVDDLITGANSRSELLKIKNDVNQILNSAKLNLCKWYSNDAEFLKTIPEKYQEKTLRINDSDVIKTLGIVWNPRADEFRFNYDFEKATSQKITKRSVLSDLARLFDPLGLINPVVVTAKIFLQELWLLKVNWDESLPIEFHNRWQSFRENLHELSSITIPRYVLSNEIISTEIHGFCDASIRAYGCCIYVRCVDSTNQISVKLLTSKSKVAPSKKSRTLPVLELLGADLLSKLWHKLKPNLINSINNVYFWTDSTIVLGWLAAHASKWQTLVANRVSSIQELTEGGLWRYVNSKANPADIISRGTSIVELKNSFWFNGPEFLYLLPEFWPPQKFQILTKLPELRKVNHKNPKTVLLAQARESLLTKIYNTSSFAKNRRIMAYVCRFLNNLKSKRLKQQVQLGILTAEELESSFLKIVYIIQQNEFATEIEQLHSNNDVQLNSNIRCLNPFIDTHSNLIRVGGRLLNADIPYNVKCPILLPKNNAFVKSYIRYQHFKNLHAGSQALIAIIRQQFWIINARDYTRRIIRSCIHCFRYRPKLLQQIMGNLPSDRVNAALAFSISGVDFCGPVWTSYNIRGKSHYKSYIAIFVCFVSKGVHLEVVSDLTSNAFIAALKRFISRRMLCKKIYCDNATNFVGARRCLSELRERFLNENFQSEIAKWCAEQTIVFQHIPPRSPHFGGLWEAAVKSAKSLLFPTFQQTTLTFEELTTACAQIESVLNSRPITQISNDPNDETALTPAHFWNQAPMESICEPQISNFKSAYLTKWQRISAIQQYFWQRWYTEYLTSLQKRYKWQTSSTNCIVGTLVLIHEDNLPPQKWLLGRIISVITGTDQKVRVADVKTKTGILRRAIHKLARLPIDEEIESIP